MTSKHWMCIFIWACEPKTTNSFKGGSCNPARPHVLRLWLLWAQDGHPRAGGAALLRQPGAAGRRAVPVLSRVAGPVQAGASCMHTSQAATACHAGASDVAVYRAWSQAAAEAGGTLSASVQCLLCLGLPLRARPCCLCSCSCPACGAPGLVLELGTTERGVGMFFLCQLL